MVIEIIGHFGMKWPSFKIQGFEILATFFIGDFIGDFLVY